MAIRDPLEAEILRQLRAGRRESLSLAGHLGCSVETVNQTLRRLQAACDGCLVLAQPYPSEPRIVVTIVCWDALKRAVAWSD